MVVACAAGAAMKKRNRCVFRKRTVLDHTHVGQHCRPPALSMSTIPTEVFETTAIVIASDVFILSENVGGSVGGGGGCERLETVH